MQKRHRRRPVTILACGALTAALALAPAVLFPGSAAAATERTISQIQGTGEQSPHTGETVSTEPAVVTAVYGSGDDGLGGFVIQQPGTGGSWDPQQPSQAVFVFTGSTGSEVEIADAVSVTGEVTEYEGLTEIVATKISAVDQDLQQPQPITGVDWSATVDARENLESMLYEPGQDFTVADSYPLYHYGELVLGADGPLVQPTEAGAPQTEANAAQRAANEAGRVHLDDGSNARFTAEEVDGGGTLPYLDAGTTIRRGDQVSIDEPVIVDYRHDNWTFNPTEPISAGDEIATIEGGDRPDAPQVGGELTIASFNVLNYFTTTGQGRAGCTGGGTDVTGSANVTWDCDVRGAWDDADLQRQQTKIVSAINELDPAVAGLMEIENSAKLGEDTDEAVQSLVQALNTAAGEQQKWAFVPSGDQLPSVADQDVISNALIYQPAKADLVTDRFADGADAGADGPFGNARTPIAAGFEPADGGSPVLVSVNHFKSKGSGPDSGPNADQGDGQGAWNPARVQQAEALADWIADVQQQTGIGATALVGDFNSYRQEDPIRALADAGYTTAAPAGEYSYTYDGLAGSLDHILLNDAAEQRHTDAAVWQINSPEPTALEYSSYRTTKIDYHQPDPYRSSDHDPVIVGLQGPSTSSGNVQDGTDASLTLLNINDFHGRIAEEEPNTTAFLGTVLEQREQAGADNTLFLSAGDNIGASLFPSSIQQDRPTIDVLNAAGLDTSAVGNHEFDAGLGDLSGRVADAADWTYLGANVYQQGTEQPALPEYETFTRSGLEVAVIGAVTTETASLVSPDGISDIEFGDPVAAVNRVAGQLSDGEPGNGEADVIIAEYHEGAVEGEPTGSLDAEVSKGGAFADIVNDTTAEVDAIFTGHTHQEYAWAAAVPGSQGRTRPVVQTGSYGELLGKVVLEIDGESGEVTSFTAENIPATETPVTELVEDYPAATEIQQIVTDALAEAEELGSVQIGTATAPITRATISTSDGALEDRAGESSVSNLVATMYRDQLADPMRGGAEIGVQNPGGNRADIDDGPISYAEAAAVLPFANTLLTVDLTGAQFKTLLEQQWQTDADGSACSQCSRPYLQLGLSDNVSYTYDESRNWGERITSITIDGRPYDPDQSYRVATASFLAAGGDNFWVFAEGTDRQDSGLIDLDSWTDWLEANSPIDPSYARRASTVDPMPDELIAGETSTLTVGDPERKTGGPDNTLDLSSAGAPDNATLTATLSPGPADTVGPHGPQPMAALAASDGIGVGTAEVTDGVATIDITVPDDAATGPATLILAAEPSGTVITLPVQVAAGSSASPTPEPTTGPTGGPTNGPSGDPTSSPAGPDGSDQPPGHGDDLAETGSDIGSGLLAGIAVLLVAGSGLLVAGVRLRR